MTPDHTLFILAPCGLVLVILFAAVARLLAGDMDEDRVRKYIAARGGQMLSLQWAPFGTGWYGSRDERIYEVHYLDADGRKHAATCKTSMLSGVYFTGDQVVAAAPTPPPVAPLPQPRVESLRRR